jgi:Lon protease-like protein
MVFFPGQVKMLHIFEPRYKELLQMCIHTGSPFGIVLDQPASREDPDPMPHRVGVMAHIFQVARQSDDTYHIQIYGGDRFQVQHFYENLPFLQAEIRSFPLAQTDTEEAFLLADLVGELLDDYLDSLTEASGYDFQLPDLPDTPEQLAYVTAAALQINNQQKQALLNTPTLPELFRQEIRYLISEQDLMNWIIDTIESPVNNIFDGYGPEGVISLN